MEPRDKPGWANPDPETTRRIRKQLGLESVVDSSVLARARDIVSTINTPSGRREYVSKEELLGVVKELKSIGYKIGNYSHLNSHELYAYVMRLQGEIDRELAVSH